MLLELNACLNRPSGQSEGEKKTCNGIIGLLRFGFSLNFHTEIMFARIRGTSSPSSSGT